MALATNLVGRASELGSVDQRGTTLEPPAISTSRQNDRSASGDLPIDLVLPRAVLCCAGLRRCVTHDCLRWPRGEPPAALYRSLAAGLARARNLKMESHVEAAHAPARTDQAG